MFMNFVIGLWDYNVYHSKNYTYHALTLQYNTKQQNRNIAWIIIHTLRQCVSLKMWFVKDMWRQLNEQRVPFRYVPNTLIWTITIVCNKIAEFLQHQISNRQIFHSNSVPYTITNLRSILGRKPKFLFFCKSLIASTNGH